MSEFTLKNLGSRKIMSNNIKKYIDMTGKTRIQVAEELGFPYSTFTDWLNGNRYPKIDKIQKMADYFGINPSDLIEEKPFTAAKKGVMIPVLGSVPAGIPLEAVEDIIDYEEIPQSLAKTGEFFGLKVKGHSMEPTITDGDIVIVRKQNFAETDDIVIAMINGEDATVKKLKITDSGIVLLPNNPSYDPFFFSKQQISDMPVSIIGRVIQLRRNF